MIQHRNGLGSDKVRSLYNAIAPFYDWETSASGFSENSRWRKSAIAAMQLARNARVLDVACGTGLNFKIIQRHLGADAGRIVGVDLSPRMLFLAQKRVERHRWTNVELVNMDMADYGPDLLFDGAICTLALEAMPDYQTVVDRIFSVLKPQGRFSMLGIKPSSWMPHRFLNAPANWLWKTGGIDVRRDAAAYIREQRPGCDYEEFWGGFCYLLSTSA